MFTWQVIEEMRRVKLQLQRNAWIYFLDDPFPDDDMLFIARLVLNDPGADFVFAKHHPEKLKPDVIARFHHVLNVENGCVRVLR